MMSVSLPVHPLHDVLEGDYCSGCGACACVSDAEMKLNDFGAYVPDFGAGPGDTSLKTEQPDLLEKACPFLSPELDEDALAAERFAQDAEHDRRLGFHHKIYAARVTEGDFRAKATSGGVGTWLGAELLRRGEIDGVIHVKPLAREGAEDPLFGYQISRSVEEIRDGAKTRYHVVEISKVIAEVRERPGRYLFIGVPCLCKAVRRLQKLDPVLAERIPFVAALICGHLKSVHWTLSLAWAGGIRPDEIGKFQYRTKDPDIPARAYVYRAEAEASTGKEPVQRDSGLVTGGKWNTCAMMLNACDFCDDVVGETSDITIGDAWLPKYTTDPKGTNLLVIRNKRVAEILEAAQGEDRVWLDTVTLEEAAGSQSGGLRHRREGLSFRLAEAQEAGVWTPQKRVEAGSMPVTESRKEVYRARTKFAKDSKIAFREALDRSDYEVYRDAMKPHEARFVRLEIGTTPVRRVMLSIFGEKTLRRMTNWRRTVPDKLRKLTKRNS